MAKKPFTPIPPMAELPPAEDINVKEILDKYLAGEIDLICVLGPTASGKTRYAVNLARQINQLLHDDDGALSAKEKRATPLAAGGGARSEGVGGVVFQTTITSASSRINITDNSALGLPHASIRMACSKGTYVRAFARDLGEALGSGAHLDSLQRSRSGIFKVEEALSVEQTLEKLAQ